MGIKPIQEENLTENLDFYSEESTKKGTVLFSSDKTKPKLKKEKAQNNSLNSNHTTTEEQNKSTKSNSTLNATEEKVKYKFKWQAKGQNQNKKLEVLLVGSFLKNWDCYEVMTKNDENGIYEYEMYLPKKEHFFKFIVNNKWQCSDLYPTKPDKEKNINNYIDLTNYKEPVTDKIYNEESFNLSKELNKLNNQSGQSFLESKYENINSKNSNNYPELELLNKNAPKSTSYYRKQFDINNLSHQNKHDKSVISANINNIYNIYGTVNNSYKKIVTLHHEKLGHLITEINEKFFKEKNYMRISSTERKRHKFLTIIYYKPN